jgi:hypothetical protein
MAAAPDLLLPQPFEYESRPDAPNFSADYGFVPLQQSAPRIEEAVAIAHFPAAGRPAGSGRPAPGGFRLERDAGRRGGEQGARHIIRRPVANI